MATWTDTIQQWGTTVLGGVVDKEFRQDFELDKMRLQAMGELGYYDEGQPQVNAAGSLVLPSGLLLVGGVLLLVFLLKD